MSTVTGPFAITPNTQLNLPQPTVAGAQESVVLDNLSTFLLQVSIGADLFYQSPLTEAKYDLSTTTQPIGINPIVTPGDLATTGEIAPTWYSVGETPPGQWPIALSGPAAVAAATAAALLTSGVPSVSVAKAITLTNVTLGPAFSCDLINVSGFASIIVTINFIYGVPQEYQFQLGTFGQFGVLLNAQFVEHMSLPDIYAQIPGGGQQYPQMSFELDTRGMTYLQISGTTTPGGVLHPSYPNVSLVGTNRLASKPLRIINDESEHDSWFLGSTVFVAGTTYTLTQGKQGVNMQGPVWISALVTGAIVKGIFYVSFWEAGGLRQIVLCDTAQFHAAGSQVFQFVAAMPGVPYALQFVPSTGGTASLQVDLIISN